MPIYKPSELMHFLEGLGIRPRKGMSQNFLIDGNILRKIVQTAEVEVNDLVLEIGSGPGSLTEILLTSGAEVIAVEKDEILAKALERLDVDNRLHIYCEDIMQFPLEEILSPLLKGKKAKVIANLPYHLTTPIIAKLAPLHEIFSTLVLMVQDEVAERFVAKPGTSEYSSFTVFLNFYSNPSYAFKVTKNCFFPPPKVNSAIVKLDLKPPILQRDVEGFFIMTRTAFQQRRKMLRVSLKDLYKSDKVSFSLSSIHLNPQARPEDLSLEQFISLYQSLCKAE